MIVFNQQQYDRLRQQGHNPLTSKEVDNLTAAANQLLTMLVSQEMVEEANPFRVSLAILRLARQMRPSPQRRRMEQQAEVMQRLATRSELLEIIADYK